MAEQKRHKDVPQGAVFGQSVLIRSSLGSGRL